MSNINYQNTKQINKFSSTELMLNFNVIKNFILDEFVHGGHLLALGAPAVTLSIMMMLRMPIRWEFLFIIYLFTLCVYNYDHYKDLKTDLLNNTKRTHYLKNHQKVLPFLIVIYTCSFFMLLLCFGTVNSIIFGTVFLFIAMLYTMKLKKITTKILGFKNIYTSFSVSLSLVFIMLYYAYPFTWFVLVLFIFLFLRFIIDTSFCDIKDMSADKKLHLKTFPLHLGKQKFLLLLHILNFFSFFLLLTTILLKIIPSFVIVFSLFIFFYNCYYIQKASNPKTNIHLLSSTIVDGEFIFWPFVLYIGSLLSI